MKDEKGMEIPEELEEELDSESEEESEEETFCDHLKKAIHEEMHDSGKYSDLAKKAAEEFPDRGYDAILRSIAKEETVHLRHLQEILFDIKKR